MACLTKRASHQTKHPIKQSIQPNKTFHQTLTDRNIPSDKQLTKCEIVKLSKPQHMPHRTRNVKTNLASRTSKPNIQTKLPNPAYKPRFQTQPPNPTSKPSFQNQLPKPASKSSFQTQLPNPTSTKNSSQTSSQTSSQLQFKLPNEQKLPHHNKASQQTKHPSKQSNTPNNTSHKT